MKQKIVRFLRNIYILSLIEIILFIPGLLKYRKENKQFKKLHKEIKLPPSYLIYKIYGFIHYSSYYYGGKNASEYLEDLIKKHLNPKNSIKILDWGCGPGRVISHLNNILPNTHKEIYGTDYDKKSIKWCKKTYKDISFNINQLSPSLPYGAKKFDVIYAISIFTHLSEELNYLWINELTRILKSNGILILTTHGDNCLDNLLEDEKRLYYAGKFVTRGKVYKGSRLFCTYHSPKFMYKFLKAFEIINHENSHNNFSGKQDIWIAKKNY